MKKTIWIGVLVMAAAFPAAARSGGPGAVVEPALSPEMIRYAATENRRTIFEAAMQDLLQQQDTRNAYWDLYDAYERERQAVTAERMRIMGEYVKNYDTFTDKQLEGLLKSSMRTLKREMDLRNKYTKLILRKVNSTVAGRFYQVDGFINASVQIGLLGNVPLLGEKHR